MRILSLIFISCLLFLSSANAKIPDVKSVLSPGGINAMIIEDHYLPIVSVNLTFTKSGFAYDPQGKSGLSYLVASLVDEGAGRLDSLEYRTKLEELATEIGFSADEDNFYISIKTLSENLDEALEIVNLTLTKPHFEEDSILRIKNQIIAILDKKQEDPQYVAMRKFKEVMFSNHPYANNRYGEKDDIQSISRNELIEFKNRHFTRDNLLVSIVGDIKTKNALKLIDRKLELPPTGGEIANLPPVIYPKKGGEYYIDKDIGQTIVIFGAPGIKRTEDDFYPAYVMNHIFGGGSFESRLMSEIREKNGLAYTTYSYLELMQNSGLLVGYVGTKNDTTNQVIKLIKNEIDKFAKKGTNKTELSDAKSYLINSFPLKMTKNSNLAAFLSVMQSNNLGRDFLEKRNSYIESTNLDDINAVAEKILDNDKMIFMVVGKNN